MAPVNSTRPKKLAAPEGHRQRSAPQRGFPRLSLAVRESLLLGGYRRVDADLNESGQQYYSFSGAAGQAITFHCFHPPRHTSLGTCCEGYVMEEEQGIASDNNGF